MKSKIIISILLISGLTTKSQDSFISLQMNGGYSFNRSLPTASIELGARLHDFYIGVQGLTHASRRADAPLFASLNVGYNIGQFKPFISYSYQTAGGEHTDVFKPDFKPGGGLTYYFSELPLLVTAQVQGKEFILSTGFNITF